MAVVVTIQTTPTSTSNGQTDVKRISRREFLNCIWAASLGILGVEGCAAATWFAMPRSPYGDEIRFSFLLILLFCHKLGRPINPAHLSAFLPQRFGSLTQIEAYLPSICTAHILAMRVSSGFLSITALNVPYVARISLLMGRNSPAKGRHPAIWIAMCSM